MIPMHIRRRPLARFDTRCRRYRDEWQVRTYLKVILCNITLKLRENEKSFSGP